MNNKECNFQTRVKKLLLGCFRQSCWEFKEHRQVVTSHYTITILKTTRTIIYYYSEETQTVNNWYLSDHSMQALSLNKGISCLSTLKMLTIITHYMTSLYSRVFTKQFEQLQAFTQFQCPYCNKQSCMKWTFWSESNTNCFAFASSFKTKNANITRNSWHFNQMWVLILTGYTFSLQLSPLIFKGSL